ncbi:hypothetical protein TNCV_1824541 [Trichonephila clavipes]|nr:hypothetical protein TNCV_1824541 [Trichonephila clavipes]
MTPQLASLLPHQQGEINSRDLTWIGHLNMAGLQWHQGSNPRHSGSKFVTITTLLARPLQFLEVLGLISTVVGSSGCFRHMYERELDEEHIFGQKKCLNFYKDL